jgi:hypothetical protein
MEIKTVKTGKDILTQHWRLTHAASVCVSWILRQWLNLFLLPSLRSDIPWASSWILSTSFTAIKYTDSHRWGRLKLLTRFRATSVSVSHASVWLRHKRRSWRMRQISASVPRQSASIRPLATSVWLLVCVSQWHTANVTNPRYSGALKKRRAPFELISWSNPFKQNCSMNV